MLVSRPERPGKRSDGGSDEYAPSEVTPARPDAVDVSDGELTTGTATRVEVERRIKRGRTQNDSASPTTRWAIETEADVVVVDLPADVVLGEAILRSQDLVSLSSSTGISRLR